MLVLLLVVILLLVLIWRYLPIPEWVKAVLTVAVLLIALGSADIDV